MKQEQQERVYRKTEGMTDEEVREFRSRAIEKPTMRSLLFLSAIFTAGGLGTICRYGVGRWTQGLAFPWGTFLVNILGCFLFGVLVELVSSSRLAPEWKPILLTGFLGGFTTFSAFAFENQQFLESRQWTLLAVNLIVQNGLGILAVIVGIGLVSGRSAA